MMDAQKQQMLQQLQSLSGGQFDRMYIQGQTTGHQELLQLHQAMAQSAATREERMLGTVAVPAIKSHLAMLQGMQQGMRG
jgi:putative membrane protein